MVCRKELVDKVGGFRRGFEGSQDYDLLLRMTEITDRIRHIPKVLYHWRMVPGSAAQVVDAKGYAFERSKQANHRFGTIAQEHGHAVLSSDAKVDERSRKAVRTGIELPVRPALVAANDGVLLRIPFGRLRKPFMQQYGIQFHYTAAFHSRDKQESHNDLQPSARGTIGARYLLSPASDESASPRHPDEYRNVYR